MSADVCNCGRPWDEHGGGEAFGPTKHWPANVPTPERGADYYRAKLRSLIADRLSEPPGVRCHFCQAEPNEWCEYDCGSPFPVLHPEYRDKTPLDRVRALALAALRDGGLLDPPDVLAAIGEVHR